MRGTFGDRLDVLQEAVGHGHLVGTLTVDQVYAHWQHEHPEFKHPDGGKAYFLRDPLFMRSDEFLKALADGLLTEDGSKIEDVMEQNMERLSLDVYDQAPWEFGDLRASGHPQVESDGEIVYDRPPKIPRQSDEELRVKNHLRELFDPDRYGKR